MNDVQTLIDSLAARLRRPVGVDDRRFRAIAYSSHTDEIDAVRRTSILGRQAPPAVTRWLEELGVLRARGYLRVPANPELGMVARVCCPVRFGERLLGLLWLVEDEGALDDAELDLCLRAAGELAQELYRRQHQTDLERRREAEAMWRLLRGASADTDTDTDDDDDGGGGEPIPIDPAPWYAALVVRAEPPAGEVAPAGLDVRLTEAVDRWGRAVAPRRQLAEIRAGRATLVVAASSPREVDDHADALLAAAQRGLADLADVRVLVGAGDAVPALPDLPGSYAHARLAVRLGGSLRGLGPLVRWAELGVTGLLGELVGERDPASLLPPPLRRLLAEPDGDALVATLEAFLEHGGDVAGAAAELFVHRSSLYNRLHRIEELAGVDIRSGADRLELHLGVRLWRMAGGCAAVPDASVSQARDWHAT